MGEPMVCPECAHEWSPAEEAEALATAVGVVRDGVSDHGIDAKVDGFGPVQLKSSVVKKA